MKAINKYAKKEKDFNFKEGDDIRIIVTSFLSATEDHWELVYEGRLVEVDSETGAFWVVLTSSTRFPFSEEGRQPGLTERIDSDKEEMFFIRDVEDVQRLDEEYPNRKDPLIRYALDG